MKNYKKFFKQAMSFSMSLLLALSPVSSVYASDASESTEAVETTEPESATESTGETQETPETEAPETAEETEYNPYILLLPKLDGVSYTADESHKDADLSSDTYDVLLYEAGEQVEFSVDSEMEFSVIEAESENVFLAASEITDGKVSFAMPETDLMVQFIQNETETQTDAQTEAQTETEPLPETETEAETATETTAETETETEPQTAAETAAEISAETETAAETAAESESEAAAEEAYAEAKEELEAAKSEDGDSAGIDYELADDGTMEKALRPESGSTVYLSNQNVYYMDKDFDVKAYIPESDTLSDADIAWESGEVNFDALDETFDIIYKATLKDDSSYSWFLDVPMTVVGEKDAASATSDGFEDRIFLTKEQSAEYTGVVPDKIGEHVQGADIEAVAGEGFSLIDVNLGYDMNLFVYDVSDDGGFDPDKAGEYNVEYKVYSLEDNVSYFFVDCKVTVKDAVENNDAMTVHIKSTELKASVTDVDGDTYEASYGTDVVTGKALKTITVSPAWESTTDVEPVISVEKDGEAVEKDGIIASESKDGDVLTVTVNENLDTGKYVFVVDYPTYEDTIKGGKSDDRRTEEYEELKAEESTDEATAVALSDDGLAAEDDVAEAVGANAAANSSKSKKWTGKSYCASLSDPWSGCTNYGWVSSFRGYRGWHLNFSSSFKTALDKWVTDTLGADWVGKVPSSVPIYCAEGGGTHMAWDGKVGMGSLSITATAYTNSKGEWSKLKVYVYCSGNSTAQGNYQVFAGSVTTKLEDGGGTLKLKKTSLGYFATEFDEVYLNCKFGIYKDKKCTKLVSGSNILRLVPADEDARTVTNSIDLDEGTYYVKEMNRSAGHAWNEQVYTVTIKNGETTNLTVDNWPFYFMDVFLIKKDADSKLPIAGAIFKVTGTTGNGHKLGPWYFKTDANGKISYDESHYLSSWNGNKSAELCTFGSKGIKYALPHTVTLTCQEVEAADGYVLDTSKHEVSVTKHTDGTEFKEEVLTCNPITVTNKKNEGSLKLKKTDVNLGSMVANTEDYSLEGAVYEVKDSSGKVVATLTTKEDGTTDEVSLTPGNYTVTETEASKGYQVDAETHNVTVVFDKTTTCNVTEAPETGSIEIHKKLEEAEPDAIKQKRDLTKINFSLTYKDNDDVNDEYGNKLTDLHPDKDGNLTIDGLYYGTWILKETTPPEYHKAMDPMEVVVGGTDDEGSQAADIELEIENYRYDGQIILAKKDIDTGKLIPRKGATFQIIDEVGNPISLLVEGASEKTSTFKTDSLGRVRFDEKIPGGKYTLKEITPPAGYKLAPATEFEITEDRDPDDPIEIAMSDERAKTPITIVKKDSVSGNQAGAGFQFNIIADEDIKDASGTVYNGFSAGSVVDTITTGSDGTAKSKDLYPGSYHIEEVSPASGYLKNEKTVSFTIVEKQDAKGNWYAEVEGNSENTFTITDTPVMRPIQVQKLDSVSGNSAGAGFTFTITAEKVVDGSGAERKGFEKGTVVDTITTDSRGIATSKDLYTGTYTIKETARAAGYALNTETYTVEVKDESKTAEPVSVKIKDTPVMKSIQVTKIDEVTGNHCGAGFVFQIVAVGGSKDAAGKDYKGYEDGAVVDTITTNADGIATSKPLYMGDYYIQETAVPSDGGMAINTTKYAFSLADKAGTDGKLEEIKDTDNTIVVPVDDIADRPTTLVLKKTDSIQKDADGNPIPLEGITFRIKLKGSADADSQLYKTDADGSLKVQYLTPGEWTIQETATIPGYNLNDEVYSFTVGKDGLINGSSRYEVTITNQPNVVEIKKTDITNSEEIAGAQMKLTDMDGNLIEEWTSDGTPHTIYGLADGQYRLIESVAPEKYEVATAIKQGTMPEDGTEKANVEGLNSEGIFTVKDSLVVQTVTMEDSPYRWVEVSKKELTGEDELPGCTLTIRDAQNEVVDTWVSTEEAHKLQLPSGVYTLTEEQPADGYVTAETIKFEVIQTTAEDFTVKKVEMRDDVTKITISKKDITNGEEIPGAHLVIKDKDGNTVEEWTSTTEPHYIEKLPIGTYTLTEVTAPDGYEVAETITFEIKDTGEIQHYEMFDSPYREVEISKTDITSGEELPGAKLEIRDKDDNVVDSWTSTAEPHMVSLPHGKYTLIETKPADGYVTAESISFEVLERNASGDVEVQHVEMEDDVTKVQISKQDVTNSKELPGAQLEIKDKDGNVIESWTSTSEVHYIEKLPIGEYTLVETTAPDGYDVAESVSFKVLDTGEIQHVVMYDSPKSTGTSTNTPTTGDINPLVPGAIIVAAIALAGVGFGLAKRKKDDNKDNNKDK